LGLKKHPKNVFSACVVLVYSPGLCGIGEDDSLREAMLLCAWFTTRIVDKSTINPTDLIVVFPGNSSIYGTLSCRI
jgi:hypothetical protein